PAFFRLSLHDALPISVQKIERHLIDHQTRPIALENAIFFTDLGVEAEVVAKTRTATARDRDPEHGVGVFFLGGQEGDPLCRALADRKSTRLNSSHVKI